VSPLSGLRYAPGRRPYSVGLNYAVPAADRRAIDTTRAALDDLQWAAVDMDGRLYRYGYSDHGAAELERIYGEDYRELMALKARVDPKGVLNPGVLR
jgi:FAD/FMN-containing dehydrogenase